MWSSKCDEIEMEKQFKNREVNLWFCILRNDSFSEWAKISDWVDFELFLSLKITSMRSLLDRASMSSLLTKAKKRRDDNYG